MRLSTKRCKKIVTKNLQGKVNGWLLEIASDRDGFTENIKGQVYLTVVKPGKLKGFHLHRLKTNHLTCLSGQATLVAWDGKKFQELHFGDKHFITIKVPPKIPIALYNRGKNDAYIINVCHPAYDFKIKEQEDLDLPWKAG